MKIKIDEYMKRPKYTSLQEIDKDLEVLQVQQELYFQKILKSSEELRQSFAWSTLLPKAISGLFDLFSGMARQELALRLVRKLFKRTKN